MLVQCNQCGTQFHAQLKGEQPRPAPATRPAFELSDHLPMIGILGGTGLLVVTMCCGFGLWFAFPPAKKQAAAPPKELVQDAPHTPISRKATTGPRSWIPTHPLPPANPATWKVTAEPTGAPPKGLLSCFPLVHDSSAAICFSSPAAARAGIVQTARNAELNRDDLIWTIYDLRQPLPIASVTTFTDWQLGGRSKLAMAGMSPSGKQIAIARDVVPCDVQVWSDDGKPVCTIPAKDREWYARYRRVLFAGESRLLLDTQGELIVVELPSGKELFRKKAAEDSFPVVSHGGQWLAQVTPQNVAWFSAADGSPAGSIDIVPQWKLRIEGELGRRDPAFALHPDGRSFALLATGENQDILVAQYDLATGAPIRQVVLPYDHLDPAFWTFGVWCGERKLLFTSGQVVDLDLKTWTCNFSSGYAIPGAPDTRVWQLAQLTAEQNAALAQKLQIPQPATEYALAAGTIPGEIIEQRQAAARQGTLLHPGLRFAVVADDSVPAEYQQTLLTALADTLAAAGFDVDPAAPLKARLTKATYTRVPNLTFDGRKFHHVSVEVEFFDGDRKLPLWASADADGQGQIANAWVELAKQFPERVKLPRMVQKDMQDQDLVPWNDSLNKGIDGLFAPGEVTHVPFVNQ
jgi:hypothetical protein